VFHEFRKILIVLGYAGAAILIVGGSYVLVQIGRGYSYDFQTHRFVLNKGLVIFDSSPNRATLTMNGKVTRRRTPYRTTLDEGEYDVQLSRPGFKTWSKRLAVQASKVTWAQYPILLPDNIKTESFTNTAPIAKTAASRDHRQFAYVTSGTDAAVWLINLDRQPTKIYTPKAATADLPAEVVTDVEWSEDASQLLLTVSVGDKKAHLLVTTGNGAVTNLTDLFRFDFAMLKFNPANARELYWVSPEGLRRINVEAQTVSAVLADKVSTYIFGNDRIFYVQTTKLGKSVFSMDRAGRDQRELIQSLPESPEYKLDYGRFRDRDLLAVLPSESRTLTVYFDIFSNNLSSKVITKNADNIDWNGDGRYLAFWSSESYGTYDIEKDIIAHSPAQPGLTQLSWYDNFHVLINSSGKAYLAEYDAANQSEIAAGIDPAFPVYSSHDGRYVLSVRAEGGLGNRQWAISDIKR
jgi:hypothetical protein